MKMKFDKLKLPIMIMGPYQFKMAPIELFFSYIKGLDLNPLKSKLISKYFYFNDLLGTIYLNI